MLIKKMIAKYKNNLYVLVSSTFYRFINLIIFIYLARIYTTYEYGYIRYVLNISLFLAMIFGSSYPRAMSRYISKHWDDKSYIGNILTNSIIGMLIVYFLEIAVLLIVFNNIYIIIVFTGYALSQIVFEYMRGIFKFKVFSFIQIIQSLALLTSIYIYTYFFEDFTIIFIFYLVIPAAVFIIIFIKYFVKYLHTFYIKISYLKMLTFFSIPVIIIVFSAWITSSIDIILLEKFWGYKYVGIYSVGRTLSSIIAIVNSSITIVILPMAAKNIKYKDNIKILKEGFIYITVLGLSIIVFLYFFGLVIIKILFTSQYTDAYNIALLLSFATLVKGLCTTLDSLWIGIGKLKVPLVVAIIRIISILIFSIILIPSLGMVGGAYAVGVTYLSNFVIMGLWTYVKRHELVRV